MDLEKLRTHEDEASRICDNMTKSMRLTVYEILNRRYGCTMSNIEHERIKAWKDEQK